MSKKTILADAIADAKAIKEAALANAKAAIAETFTPQIRSMISGQLQEELADDLDAKGKATNESEEEDLDEGDGFTGAKKTHGKDAGYTKVSGVKEGKDDAEEEGGNGKEEIDEASDLDALLAELEASDDDEDMSEKFAKKDDNAATDDSDKITPMDEKGGEEGGEEKGKDSEYELFLKLKNKFEPKPNQKPKDEAEGDGSEEGADDGFDIESIIRELENEAKGQGYADDDGDDNGTEVEANEVKYTAVDKNAAKDNKDKITPMDEVEKELKEIEAIKKDLNEVNLMNAKLLYFNKIIREQDNLTKSEKVSFLKQFDKATTPKEAKMIYSVINESLKPKSKKNQQIKENLGFASKAAGNAPKKAQSTEAILNEETVKRFKFLAGL